MLLVSDGAHNVGAIEGLLSVAREGHTVNVVGPDVLVCGGKDAGGMPLDVCDLLDGTTLALKQTSKLALARWVEWQFVA